MLQSQLSLHICLACCACAGMPSESNASAQKRAAGELHAALQSANPCRLCIPTSAEAASVAMAESLIQKKWKMLNPPVNLLMYRHHLTANLFSVEDAPQKRMHLSTKAYYEFLKVREREPSTAQCCNRLMKLSEHLTVLAPPTLAASVPDTQFGLLAAFTQVPPWHPPPLCGALR